MTVAENLAKRAESLRKNSVSRSTLKTRRKQWACYEKICKKFGWKFFSCDSSQACKYFAYLSDVMKYSSVINYYQTVIFFHKVKGYSVAGWSNMLVSQTVKGIKNSQKIPDDVKDPLTQKHLEKMYRKANTKTHMGLMVWTMIVFLFSTLLRVSHVVLSPHTLLRKDITFFKWGVLVCIRSSKTKKEPFQIPKSYGRKNFICPVYWLERFFTRYPRSKREILQPTP